jgi:hypothetical protein
MPPGVGNACRFCLVVRDGYIVTLFLSLALA